MTKLIVLSAPSLLEEVLKFIVWFGDILLKHLPVWVVLQTDSNINIHCGSLSRVSVPSRHVHLGMFGLQGLTS